MIYASLKEAWDTRPVRQTKVVLTDPEIVKYFHSFEEEPDLVVRRLLERRASENKTEKIESFRGKKVHDNDVLALIVLLFLILFY